MNSLLQFLGPHSLLGRYGYLGIFSIIFLESMGLPLPGETTLVVASGLTASGTFHPLSVWATAVAAATTGDNIAYVIGKKGGRPLVLHHGGRVGITHEQLNHAERIMARRGWLVVFLARFFPLLRQLNGLAAGTTGMHWRTFLLANASGAIVWAGLWTYLGDWLGARLRVIPWAFHHVGLLAVILLPVIGILAIFGLRHTVQFQPTHTEGGKDQGPG